MGIGVDIVNVVVEKCVVVVFPNCVFECVCNVRVVCGVIQDELFFDDDAIELAYMSAVVVPLSSAYSLLNDGIFTNFEVLVSKSPHNKFKKCVSGECV